MLNKKKKQRTRIFKDGKYYSIKGILLEFCSETMTRAELFSWIRSHARRLSLKWKPRSDFLMTCRRPYEGKDKRTKWEYCCNNCKQWYKLKDVEVDHIIPCGALNSWNDIGEFYERLLAEKDGYRILCKLCHRERTNRNMDRKSGNA